MICSRKSIVLTVCLYLLLGFAWIIGTDFVLEIFSPDPQMTAGWQFVKGLAFVLGTSIFFYLALRSTAAKVAVEIALTQQDDAGNSVLQESLQMKPLRLRMPVGIFLVTIFVFTVVGFSAYLQLSRTMRRNVWADLRNVAGLKARQVKTWRQERFGDVATITGDSSFMDALQEWLQQGGRNQEVSERITRRLDAIRRGYGYRALLLCDTHGRVRFSTSDYPTAFPPGKEIDKALREGRPVFSAFQDSETGGAQVVDVMVPLVKASTTETKVFGVFVFRMAVDNRLFPGLQWWPSGIHSAETLLVQKVAGGPSVVVSFQHAAEMKIIRDHDESAKNLQFFLSQARQGDFEEILDYRGVPVLAVVEDVPNSDWLMIAKVDQDEIYSSLKRLSIAIAAAGLFLIGASAVAIILWWRQQLAGFAVSRLQDQLQRQALRKQLDYLTRFANDIILLLDGEGVVVEANNRAVTTYGYPVKELIGKNVRELNAPEARNDFDSVWQKVSQQGALFETVHCRADGSCFPVEVSAKWVETEGQQWCQSIIRDISERKQAEHHIHRLTRLYDVLSQTNQAIVRHCDQQTLFEDICRIAVELGGLRMAVITSINLDTRQFVPVAAFGAESLFEELSGDHALQCGSESGPISQVIKSGKSFVCNDIATEASLQCRAEFAKRYGFESVALFPLFRGEAIFGTLDLYASEKNFFENDLLAVLEEMSTDITFALNNFDKERARKKAEERLRKTSAMLTTVFQATPLPIIIRDLEGRVQFWNSTAEHVFGWSEREVFGRLLPVVPDERKQEFFDSIEHVRSGQALSGIEVQRRCRDGRLLDMLLFVAPLYDTRGNVENIISLYMDVSEQKMAREHIVCLAHYDQLTGLGNRTLLRERFIQEASRALREQRNMALCLIDLDKFKMVNDSLGHTLGDKLLIQVARRLEDSLRRVDVICRPGGDEFLVLLSDLEKAETAGTLARKILKNLERPFSLEGHTVRMSASMGISIFPEDGRDLDSLFRNADTAMYAAKEKGRNHFMLFRAEMDQKIRNRLELETSLRVALDEKTLFLHYQPQVEIVSGQVVGVEALLRFRHPDRGLVPPDSLIPIAEDSGLIVPLGEWILEEACRQLALWKRDGLGGLSMAVNLSAVQVFQENFASRTEAILRAFDIHPGSLNLELTESIFMEEDERVRRTLLALKQLGVRISLDDFGTGYSSLSYLKRYAVDEIKIDRTFVQDLCGDSGDAAIVRATIQMAHSLGLRAVAEGVETAEQLVFLQNQGCDLYQGYLCSCPLHADDFWTLMQSFSS